MPKLTRLSPLALVLAALLTLQQTPAFLTPAAAQTPPAAPPSASAAPAGAAHFDLTTVPDDYFFGTRTPLEFKLVNADQYDLVIFEAWGTVDGETGIINEFRGLADMQRGGVRVISGDWMQKLPLGTWTLKLIARDGDLVAEKKINVRTASLIEEATQAPREYVEPVAVVPNEEEPKANLDEQLKDLLDTLTPEEDGVVEYEPQPDTRVVMIASGGDLAAGYEQLREGSADMLLLQAGGTYELNSPILWAKSGRSATEPLVVTTYGLGARPVITTKDGFLKTLGGEVSHVAFNNIELVAAPVGGDDDESATLTGANSTQVAVHLAAPANNVTFQYTNFRNFATHIVADDPKAGDKHTIRKLYLRRCLFVDSTGHGVRLKQVDTLNVRACVFDHNGWTDAAGRKGENHNLLLQGVANAQVASNVFARECHTAVALEAGNAGVPTSRTRVVDNLFLDNYLPVALAQDDPAGVVVSDSAVLGNVFLRTGDTCDGAVNGVGATLQNSASVNLNDNIFTDKDAAAGSDLVQPAVTINDESTLLGIKVTGNKIQWPVLAAKNTTILLISDTSGQPVKNSSVALSSNLINIAKSNYADPDRTIATYDALLGNEGDEPVASFLGSARTLNSKSYKTQFTAEAVVTYIKQGFALKPGAKPEEPPVVDEPTNPPGGGKPPVVNPGGPLPPLVLNEPKGWSDFKLAGDGRIIYVSSSSGNDSNDGRTPATAVKTPDRGIALLRDNSADQLLFKRGDIFTDGLGQWKLSGKSASEPLIVSCYGDEKLGIPEFRVNSQNALQATYTSNLRHITFANLSFREVNREAGKWNNTGGIVWDAACENIRFEGLSVKGFCFNISMSGRGPSKSRGITLYRCVIADAWSIPGKSHSQGMYMKAVGDVQIVECVFDHNGWSESAPGSSRTGFNQNLYIKECPNVLLAGNLFLRGSYFGVKIRSDVEDGMNNVTVRDNVFSDNASPFGAGSDHTGEQGVVVMNGLTVQGNLITRAGTPNNKPASYPALHFSKCGNVNILQNLIVHRVFAPDRPVVNIETFGPHGSFKIDGNVTHNYPLRGGQWLRGSSGQINILANLINPTGRFTDPNLTMERYAQSVGLSNPNALYAAAAAMQRGRWNDDFTAFGILKKFRPAYNMASGD